jgi:hypothetical protein
MKSGGSVGDHPQELRSGQARSLARLLVGAVGAGLLSATLSLAGPGEVRGAVHRAVGLPNPAKIRAVSGRPAARQLVDGGEPVSFKILETAYQLLQEAHTPGGPLANLPSWVHSYDGPLSSNDVEAYRHALKFLPEYLAVLPMTFDSDDEEIEYFLLRSKMSLTSLVKQLKASAKKFGGGADEKVVLTRTVVLHGKAWSRPAYCAFDRYVGSGPPGASASCDVIYDGAHNVHYDVSVMVNNPTALTIGTDRAATPREALTIAEALAKAAMDALRLAEQRPRNILPTDLIAP